MKKIVLVLNDRLPQICIKDGKKMTTMFIKEDEEWMVYCTDWKMDDGFEIVEMGEWEDIIELDGLLREADEILSRYLGGTDLYTKIKEVY
jgi:hypothetical protein